MTTIQWHQPGERTYETGVDRGVLYGSDRLGVAWNGLTSVEMNPSDEVVPVYFDGVKFNDIVTRGDVAFKIKAFTYPDELLAYQGILEGEAGVFYDNQPLHRFHLCYRTMIGDDLNPEMSHYKLHMLYNLTAVPTNTEYETMTLDTEPIEFEWDVTAIPEQVDGFRPTAHMIVDSRDIPSEILLDLEGVLYGTSETDARLPSMRALTNFLRNWNRQIIIDNGDGTWTAIIRDDADLTMLSATEFQIDNANATYLDAETYEISSTDLNEEDL